LNPETSKFTVPVDTGGEVGGVTGGVTGGVVGGVVGGGVAGAASCVTVNIPPIEADRNAVAGLLATVYATEPLPILFDPLLTLTHA
jgi:hypothetical protein